VNAAVAGIYTLTYNAVDGSGNAATPITRTITITDVTPPAVFTLLGASSMSLLVGARQMPQVMLVQQRKY